MVQSTDDEFDAQFDAAEARGRERAGTEPCAKAARYDPETRRVVIELANGCAYIFPVALSQELHGADDARLAEIVVDGAGFNLHWPRLDADLHVPRLVAGVFGTRDWMARDWAREAGRATSPAKAAASRANGARGGRPRKRAG